MVFNLDFNVLMILYCLGMPDIIKKILTGLASLLHGLNSMEEMILMRPVFAARLRSMVRIRIIAEVSGGWS
jgi:hypothetical protein